MIALFMGLAMMISGSFADYTTATIPGDYYEFVAPVKCEEGRSWTIGLRYKVEPTLVEQKQHLQVRSLPGCVGVQAFINEAVVDPHIKVIGR